MPDSSERPQATLEKEVLLWADSVYDEAEREQADSREIRLTSRLIDYISGQQWNAKSRYGRSRPTVNRLFRQFIEMAGLLTDIEPDFQVKFHNEDEQFYALQNLLNEMITMWARVTDFEMELTQAVMWALLHTGWAKIQWNPFMNNGMGSNEFMPLGPINVMTIGAGRNLQDDECVIARWPVTLEALIRTFGDVAVGVEPDLESSEPTGEVARPGKMSQASWVRLNPQLKKLLGKRNSSDAKRSRYPKAMLKQFWFKDSSKNETSVTKWVGDQRYNWAYQVEPGMPWYPRGRFLICAGGKVLQDQCNPYWHAMFPFAKLRLIRVPWSPQGLSVLEPIAMMSDIVNRINGGIMDMIRAAIEPRIQAPKAAFAQSVWDSMDPGAPGSKIMYNNNTPREPSFPKPPELPAYVLTMKQDVEKEQDMTSGGAAINQSLQKKQVPGGDSLEMIMNSRSIPIRFMGRGLSSFLTEAGSQVVANEMQFSTSKSRIKLFGTKGLTDADFEYPFGQFLQKGMQPEEFVRQAVFSIRKGSLLAIEKQEEVQIAFAMVKLGVLSRKALYRKLGIPQAEQDRIEQELISEAKEKIALAQAAGGGQHAAGHGKK
jgi:hypothetical protein